LLPVPLIADFGTTPQRGEQFHLLFPAIGQIIKTLITLLAVLLVVMKGIDR
jgi:hypothetical protein